MERLECLRSLGDDSSCLGCPLPIRVFWPPGAGVGAATSSALKREQREMPRFFFFLAAPMSDRRGKAISSSRGKKRTTADGPDFCRSVVIGRHRHRHGLPEDTVFGRECLLFKQKPIFRQNLNHFSASSLLKLVPCSSTTVINTYHLRHSSNELPLQPANKTTSTGQS